MIYPDNVNFTRSDITVSNQYQIKLAEAMGWTETKYHRWLSPAREMRCDFPPDPFTDANDDYAVLEWMRDKPRYLHNEADEIEWCTFSCELPNDSWSYQIGDYARAALKVLVPTENNSE